MENEREMLQRGYAALVELYMHTNQIRQNRVNWNFLVQGALLAAVLGTEHLAIRLIACVLGLATTLAAFLVVGRHTAHMALRGLEMRELEHRLPLLRASAAEKELFGPPADGPGSWWQRLARQVAFPLPTGRNLRCDITGEEISVQWHGRFSANTVEQFVIGPVIFLAWLAVLVLVAAGCLGNGAADWGFFIGLGRR